jgi:ribonucleoside-diphosphate reductase alpha chain
MEWKQKFYEALVNLDNVPAGRVLMGAGSETDVTFFNCYVMPFIHDSRGGIAEHRKMVMEIMSRGGGVGTNGSTLRPRDTVCQGVNGKSSGSVTWLHDLSELTNLVQQGGTRRGAQMIMLNSWHADIIEFIISKMQNPKLLRRIKLMTRSKLIHDEVDRKLKFTPLSSTERIRLKRFVGVIDSAMNYVSYGDTNISDDDMKAYNEAKELLAEGGRYSVHDENFLTGANISVCLTSDFMEAVENNDWYELRFPDVENYDEDMKRIYNEEWQQCGDVREWEARGYGVKVYHRIKAKELWKLINICATYSAEPGVFFLDNANEMTNAVAYGQKVVATNPCGEQPLSPFAVCNLSALNLSEMTKDGEVDFDRLKNAVKISVRMQDNVIDATPYFLEENTKQALGERRVGMGVMGLHDMLIRCSKRYGSEEGNDLVDQVFETIALTAYESSIELAQEKGSFPFLDVLPDGTPNVDGRRKFIDSGFMKKMPEYIRKGVWENGIRNSHLLTVAPTGSTGTMLNVSTGLEPYFNFKYFRSGRLGKFIPVVADIAVEWLETNGYTVTEENVDEMIEYLPDYFVGSMQLSAEEHADTQCVIQRWIDSSISKTVNAPRGYTVAQVEAIYERLHRGGAKGGTVYVDGSRDAQVLSITAEENTFDGIGDVEEVLHESKHHECECGGECGDCDKHEVVCQVEDEPKQKRGGDAGDLCYLCGAGTMMESGGCITCSNCGFQSKCGL